MQYLCFRERKIKSKSHSLTIDGNASRHSVVLRPTRSDIQPNSTDPHSPPMPISEHTHDSCSALRAPPANGVSCSDLRTSTADDGQPAVVPYEIEIRFTAPDQRQPNEERGGYVLRTR